MLGSVQKSRFVSVVVLSLFALHCGTDPGPDGFGSGGEPGTGGEGTTTGGQGFGGEAGGVADSGGSGGHEPEGPVTEVSQNGIGQVDLLFVVDNSVSMADKQALLVQAVPKLIERLVTPDCIDLEDGARLPSDGLKCPPGAALELAPVDDLHIGVISSSLGGFAANSICTLDDDVDRSRLIPKVRTGVADPNGLGFLEWSGGGIDDAEQLGADFTEQIAAVGETGCGFEAPLEAWYRFLVDPSPPLELDRDQSSQTVSTGIDTAILEQRAAFLRPGSLVTIVLLTDEDDCSVMEGGGYYQNAGFGWLIPDIQRGREPGSEACATNPNDACCYSCLQTAAPEGCEDTCERDSGGDSPVLAPEDDRANMRCALGKRRFGIDLLYPAQRYIDGLTEAVIVDSQLTTDPDDPVKVPNPLLLGAALDPSQRVARPANQVLFAGIIGVPWQDIATPATRTHPSELEYLDARGLRQPVDELDGRDRWALILGEPNLPASAPECQGEEPPEACGQAPVAPLDPFMVQSILPREGENPITGDEIVGLGASAWSAINGSEYDISALALDDNPSNDDLQYACIFPLSEAAVKEDCLPADASCECGEEPKKGSPLCKAPGSQASDLATTTQYWGKAYPAPRVLEVLEGIGDGAIVASICPKVVNETESPYFGYGPALNAVLGRLAGTRGGMCLQATTSWDEEDEASCAVVEATSIELDCERAGRAALDEDLWPDALEFLEDEGYCGGAEFPCDSYGLCALLPVEDPELCFSTEPAETQSPGYCLIDPARGPEAGGQGEDCSEDPESWGECDNPNLAVCSASERRMLRFVGENTPARSALVFRVCSTD